jgi:GNAT superfamily N-acetyltransferase
MVAVTVAALGEPTTVQLAEVAVVFDQYRQHYGQPVTAGQTVAWLAGHTRQGRLTVFTAHIGEELAGLATAVSIPASQRLGCFWQLRDLYVVPGARHRGAGRALLDAVRQAAAGAGAIRLSVQTEPGNTAALQLYRTAGFIPVEDLCVLSLSLPHDGT